MRFLALRYGDGPRKVRVHVEKLFRGDEKTRCDEVAARATISGSGAAGRTSGQRREVPFLWLEGRVPWDGC